MRQGPGRYKGTLLRAILSVRLFPLVRLVSFALPVLLIPPALPGLAGCRDPWYPEDTYSCTPDAADTCPPGWVCLPNHSVGEYRCYSSSGTNCEDGDGDGYGAGCFLGEDCDDSASGIVGPCQPNGCPQGWILVAAGDFWMGCNEGELDGTCRTEEQPRHQVTLSAYCIEETEVSVGAYRECHDAGVCTGTPTETVSDPWCNWSAGAGPLENHPINCINFAESQEYCQAWLGGDLPTEAEWEKSARGSYPDQRSY
ncbi:formylglycine-generating enzyme family protein, partial [Myxococcota bacterium]